jgi:hypothetical protein
MEKAIAVRSKCKHFRILIIGRSNAGKTTILKKVCNSIDEPMIVRQGKRFAAYYLVSSQFWSIELPASVVGPSGEVRVNGDFEMFLHGLHIQRGEHNINNQLGFENSSRASTKCTPTQPFFLNRSFISVNGGKHSEVDKMW